LGKACRHSKTWTRGLSYNSLYRPTIGYFSIFGISITNAYSTHFVKSSGLNAKAKLPLHKITFFLQQLAICDVRMLVPHNHNVMTSLNISYNNSSSKKCRGRHLVKKAVLQPTYTEACLFAAQGTPQVRRWRFGRKCAHLERKRHNLCRELHNCGNCQHPGKPFLLPNPCLMHGFSFFWTTSKRHEQTHRMPLRESHPRPAIAKQRSKLIPNLRQHASISFSHCIAVSGATLRRLTFHRSFGKGRYEAVSMVRFRVEVQTLTGMAFAWDYESKKRGQGLDAAENRHLFECLVENKEGTRMHLCDFKNATYMILTLPFSQQESGLWFGTCMATSGKF